MSAQIGPNDIEAWTPYNKCHNITELYVVLFGRSKQGDCMKTEMAITMIAVFFTIDQQGVVL